MRLVKIFDHPEPEFLAVFVHGLWGHWECTWRNPRTAFSWPKKLPFPKYRSYALDYPAPICATGASSDFDLEDVSTVAMQLVEDELRRLLSPDGPSVVHAAIPIVFICHSLGGIVAKRMLEKVYNDPERPISLLRLCRKVVLFIGTPHLGSHLANLLFALTPRRYRSQTLAVLASKHPMAQVVDQDFTRTSSQHQIACESVAELSGIGGLLHVAHLDSMLHRLNPVALTRTLVREQHISVVKPPDKDGLIIEVAANLIERLLRGQAHVPAANFTLTPTRIAANYKPDPGSVDEHEGHQFVGDYQMESRIECVITKINLLVERGGHYAICSAPGRDSYRSRPPENPGASGYVQVGGEKRFVDGNRRFLQPFSSKPGENLTLSISLYCRAIGMSKNEPATRSIRYWIDRPTQIVQIEYRYASRCYREDHHFDFSDPGTMKLRRVEFRWLD